MDRTDPPRPRKRGSRIPIDPYFVAGLGVAVLAVAILRFGGTAQAGPPPGPSTLSAEFQNRLSPLDLAITLGREDAPVEVVLITDYQCPACTSAEEALQPVLREMTSSGRVRFTSYDVPLPSNNNAQAAAVMAACVQEQSPALYWTVRGEFYRRSDSWSNAYPVEPVLAEIATAYGADRRALDGCVARNAADHAQRMRDARQTTSLEGFTYVPVVAVNGTVVSWSQVEKLLRTIDAAESGSAGR